MVSTLFLEKALKTLEEALRDFSQKKDDLLVRDGVIQRFEYSFELATKTLERILKQVDTKNEFDLAFYKPMIRMAAQKGLIDSPEAWFEFKKARNKTSHAYDEDIAQEVFNQIPTFLEAAKKLLMKLKDVKQ